MKTITLPCTWLFVATTVTLVFAGRLCAGDESLAQMTTTNQADPTYLRDVLPILMGKCANCHGDQHSVLPNWLNYRTAFGDRLEIKRRVWDSWNGSYYKQPMPAGNNLEAQTMTLEQRLVIKHWVEDGAPRGAPQIDSGFRSKVERIELGKRLFSSICAACHQPAGLGIPSLVPPLAGSDFLNADKRRAIRIAVNGLQGALVVNGQRFNNSMPKLPLTDSEFANVLTYVYSSFGNSGKEVTAEDVAAVRAEKDDPNIAEQTKSAKVPEAKSPFE